MTKKDPSWFFCHCWPDCLPAGGPLSKQVICPVRLCVPVFYFFHAFSSSCVCVCEIYGRTETSHHTAPHNRQCLTSLQPKKHPETSQQCINGTAFTTVWPAVTSVPNTHTESITGECDGFLWDVWFGLFLEMLFRVKLPGGQRQFNKKCLQNGL